MKPSSKFDIIVYGATGFTGRLVAEYLAQHYTGKSDPKWAMAGRSLEKLASVRDAIGAPAGTSLIQADARISSMAPNWSRPARPPAPIISISAASRSGCVR